MGASLAVQWLGLHTSTAGDPGSIPGWGAKILQATLHGLKKEEEDCQRILPSQQEILKNNLF